MDGEGMQLSNNIMYTGMDTKFELQWQKSENKELTRLLWNKLNVLDFSTRFSSRLVKRL